MLTDEHILILSSSLMSSHSLVYIPRSVAHIYTCYNNRLSLTLAFTHVWQHVGSRLNPRLLAAPSPSTTYVSVGHVSRDSVNMGNIMQSYVTQRVM